MNVTGLIAPMVSRPLLRRVKWTWVGYGVAAYAGLRLMKRYNVMPGVADKGLRLFDQGIRVFRSQSQI